MDLVTYNYFLVDSANILQTTKYIKAKINKNEIKKTIKKYLYCKNYF